MSYDQLCENEANDIKEHMAKEDLRRQQEFLVLERQLDQNTKRLAEIRQYEIQRRKTEEENHAKNLEKAQNAKQKAYDRNRKKEEERLEKDHKNEMKALSKHNEILEKQKESYETKLEGMSERQAKQLIAKEEKMKKEADDLAEKVMSLKSVRDQTLKEIAENKIKFSEDTKSNQDKRDKEIAALHGKEDNLLLERERELLAHEERLAFQEKEYIVNNEIMVISHRKDMTEQEFVNSVSNTRTAGMEVTNAVGSLRAQAYRLKKGNKRDETIRISLERIIDENILSKTTRLRETVKSILGRQEHKNEATGECQKMAREIEPAIGLLEASIFEFRASLEDDPVDNSRELFKAVETNSRDLATKVISLPVVYLSNHLVETIVKQTAALAMGRQRNEQPPIDYK